MSFELMNEILSISSIPREISFDVSEPPDWVTSVTPILSADAEMSFECELGPGAAKIFGLDLSNGPDVTCNSVIFKSPRQVQIRRHKKKRINKKWNKKFGPRYITKFQVHQLEGVLFKQIGPELTIVGERAKMITPSSPLYI